MKFAKWIWNDDNGENRYLDFYGSFECDLDEKISVDISVTGDYVLYLNNEFTSCQGSEDFPERKIYDTVDVTSKCRKGINTYYIIAHAPNKNSSNTIACKSALIFEIYTDKKVLAFSSSQTKVRKSTLYPALKNVNYGNGNYFCSDMDLTDLGFHEIGYYSDYEAAKTVDVSYRLFPRTIKKCAVGQRISSVLYAQGVFRFDENCKNDDLISEKLCRAYLSSRRISDLSSLRSRPVFPLKDGVRFESKDGDGLYFVFDLGAERGGFFTFDIELDKEAELKVAFGEHLDDLRVRARISGRSFTSEIKLPSGKTFYTDYLRRYGCRYIQIYILSSSVKINYIGLKETYYPVKTLPFYTDNALRMKIYETSVRTLRECMHEHYEDCPWREQSLYAMDSRNQMLCGYYAFGEYDFPKENIRMLLTRFRHDGLTPITAPCGIDLTIPAFSLVIFRMVKEYIVYSGDTPFALEISEKLKKLIKVFTDKANDDGLLQSFTGDSVWNFCEWTPLMANRLGKDSDIEYPMSLNAFYADALDSLAFIENKLGKEASFYTSLANRTKESTRKLLWDKERQIFAGCSLNGELRIYNELCNSLAIYSGIATKEQAMIIAEKLSCKENGLTPVSISMSLYKYMALLSVSEKYLKFILDEIDEKWGYMLYNGATTFWETLEGADDFSFAGSLCHGWSAVPVYIYGKYINDLSE